MWKRRFLLLTLSALLASPWIAESQSAGTPTPTPTPTPLPPAGPFAGPVFFDGFPQVTNIGADSLDIAAALDRYGKVVYAVAKAGHNDPLPKSVATKFATTYGDGVVALGDFTSVGQGLVAYQDVSGSLAPELPDILQPGESYKIFLIPVDARDGAHNGVLSKIEVTMGGEGAPAYSTGHPQLQNPTSATFDIVLSVRQSSILHYAALPSGDELQVALDDLGISTPEGGSMQRIVQGGLPTLRAMQQASTFFAGVAQNPKFTLPIYENNTVYSIEIRDLEPGKDYNVYFALQAMTEPNSTSGQFMEEVIKRSVTTLAMPLPPPSPPPPPPPPSLPPPPNPSSPPLQPPPPQIYGLRPPPPATDAGNSGNPAPPIPIPSRTVHFQAVFADASASSLSSELDLDILKQLFLAALELAVNDILSLAIGNPVYRPQTSLSVASVAVGSIILQASVEFTGFLEAPAEQAATAFQIEVESGGSTITYYIERDLKLVGLGIFRTFAQDADVSRPWPPPSNVVPSTTSPMKASGLMFVIIGGSAAVAILLALLAGYVYVYRNRAAKVPAEAEDDLQWGRSMMSITPSPSSRKPKPAPTRKIAVTPAASKRKIGDTVSGGGDDDSSPADGGADVAAAEDAIRSSSRLKEPPAMEEGGKLRRAYTFQVADRDAANAMLSHDKKTTGISANLSKHSSSRSRSRIVRTMSARAEAELMQQQHQQGDTVSGTGGALHNRNTMEVPIVTTTAPRVTSNGVSSSSPRLGDAQSADNETRQDPGPLAATTTRRHNRGTSSRKLLRTTSSLHRNAAALLLEHRDHQLRQR